MHGIIIRPAIEVGWLDILLAQQRGYLRTMIDGVVDGLDQHDDDRSIIGPPVKMEDFAQFPLFRDRETQVRPEVILKKSGSPVVIALISFHDLSSFFSQPPQSSV